MPRPLLVLKTLPLNSFYPLIFLYIWSLDRRPQPVIHIAFRKGPCLFPPCQVQSRLAFPPALGWTARIDATSRLITRMPPRRVYQCQLEQGPSQRCLLPIPLFLFREMSYLSLSTFLTRSNTTQEPNGYAFPPRHKFSGLFVLTESPLAPE